MASAKPKSEPNPGALSRWGLAGHYANWCRLWTRARCTGLLL